MKKNVKYKMILIRCYYGDFFISCPYHFKRSYIRQLVIDYARELHQNPIISDLPNFEYYTETDINKFDEIHLDVIISNSFKLLFN